MKQVALKELLNPQGLDCTIFPMSCWRFCSAHHHNHSTATLSTPPLPITAGGARKKGFINSLNSIFMMLKGVVHFLPQKAEDRCLNLLPCRIASCEIKTVK